MHPVLKTVLQRLGLGLLTLFVVSVVIFSSLELLPGGFAEAILGQGATPETVAAFNREIGLDRPAAVRYVEWIGDVLHGRLRLFLCRPRRLASSRACTDLIAPRLYNTFFLAIMTAIVAVPLSLFLGILAALYRNSWYDRIVNSVDAHHHRHAGILHRLSADVLLRDQDQVVLSAVDGSRIDGPSLEHSIARAACRPSRSPSSSWRT